LPPLRMVVLLHHKPLIGTVGESRSDFNHSSR
jgi:hypothetical protein